MSSASAAGAPIGMSALRATHNQRHERTSMRRVGRASAVVHVILFRSDGWESWDVKFEPLVRAGIPALVDDDLLFENPAFRPRPAVVVNHWLREDLVTPSDDTPAALR
jgi:hypothetical protein